MNLDQLRILVEGSTLDRARELFAKRDKINEQIAKLSKEQSEIDNELTKLAGSSAPRQRRQSGGRRGGIREKVIAAIKASPGISPAQVRKAVGIADGDKSGSQSVSNALWALKRAGQVKETAPRQYAVA